jgi:hypothetical protein
MEEAPENGKKSLHSAHASGINELHKILIHTQRRRTEINKIFIFIEVII